MKKTHMASVDNSALARITLAMLLATASSPVLAQTAAAPEDGSRGAAAIDDIVVTARKQNESVLKAPVSVTVLTADNLAAKNITSGNQLGGIVPGLVMQVGVGGLPGTTFRGLGSASSVFGLEASVAQFQDGMYLGHGRDYIMPLYDIAQVELIKGTQSTLLGKNVSLGAISITNRRPGETFGYNLRLSHGFEIDQLLVEGGIDLPISEQLTTRVAFLYSKEDGYYRNEITGNDEPRVRNGSVRVTTRFRPTDAFEATLIYQHDNRRMHGQPLEIVSDPANVMRNRALSLGQVLNTAPDGISGSASHPVGGTVAAPDPFDRQVNNRLNLIATLDLGDYTLTSQTAYLRGRGRYSIDVDFTTANLFNLDDTQTNTLFSQELRINSPQHQSFTWLAGVFYYWNKWELDRRFGGSPSNTIGYPLTGEAVGSFNQPTSTFSAFASGTYHILDALRVSAGLRYTHETKKGDFARTGSGSFGGAFPAVPFTVYPKQTARPLDYDFGVQFEPSPNVMLYASHAKGSKSGSFQEFPTTPAGAPFSGETTYSTELGVKVRLAGGGYVTAAAFNTLLKDYQIATTYPVGNPPVSQTVVQNGDARSRGFEGAFAVPLFTGFRVSGNVVYADTAMLERFPQVGALIADKGDQLARAPKWTTKFGADYETDVSADLQGFAGVSLATSSSYLHHFWQFRPDQPIARAHQILDARIGLRSDAGGWEIALSGSNLNNQRYIVFDTPVSATGGIGAQAYYGTYSAPRVISLQFKIEH